MTNNAITTFDKTVFQLCEEVDYWKDEAIRWKSKYEEEVSQRIQFQNERFEETKKGVANALMFALSVKDDANGNLIISSEDRKTLSENYIK